MNQQQCSEQSRPSPRLWTQLSLQEQIREIEELISSSCWRTLDPDQKKNWRRQLNGLRCRMVFQSAYAGRQG